MEIEGSQLTRQELDVEESPAFCEGRACIRDPKQEVGLQS